VKSDGQYTIFDSESGTSFYEYKLGLEKIKNELEKFGLTKTQSKTYIYLGKYGSKTASEVSKSLDFPRTETYQILNSLQNKGIVLTEMSHPTKFSVLPIEKAILTMVNVERERIDEIANREQELVKLWNKIPFFIVEINESKPEKLQTIQGTGTINNKIKEMIYDAKDLFRIYGSEKDLARFYHDDLIKILENSLVDMKLLISPSLKVPDFISDIDRKKLRIMPNNTENKCFIIKDNSEVLIYLRNATHPSRRVFSFWSDSKSLIDSMDSLFELSWDKAAVPY